MKVHTHTPLPGRSAHDMITEETLIALLTVPEANEYHMTILKMRFNVTLQTIGTLSRHSPKLCNKRSCHETQITKEQVKDVSPRQLLAGCVMLTSSHDTQTPKEQAILLKDVPS